MVCPLLPQLLNIITAVIADIITVIFLIIFSLFAAQTYIKTGITVSTSGNSSFWPAGDLLPYIRIFFMIFGVLNAMGSLPATSENIT